MTASGDGEVADSESAAVIIECRVQRWPIDYERCNLGAMDAVF